MKLSNTGIEKSEWVVVCLVSVSRILLICLLLFVQRNSMSPDDFDINICRIAFAFTIILETIHRRQVVWLMIFIFFVSEILLLHFSEVILWIALYLFLPDLPIPSDFYKALPGFNWYLITDIAYWFTLFIISGIARLNWQWRRQF